MLDMFATVPPQMKSDVQKFYGANPTANSGYYQVWRKPRGISMVDIIAIGAAGGGGGGANQVAGNNAGGGGGGGTSSVCHILIPSMFLPDFINLSLGLGGTGGNAAQNGGAGVDSDIFFGYKNFSSNVNTYLHLYGGGGGVAGGASGGAGGSGAAVTQSGSQWQSINLPFTLSTNGGRTGNAGGSGSAAISNIAAFNTYPFVICQGQGGAGIRSDGLTANGGDIFTDTNLRIDLITFHTDTNGVLVRGGRAAGALHGSSGWYNAHPFFCLGGGGGASNAVRGGDGGRGAYGGGGGGGAAGAAGGVGGRGGESLVIITSW